MSDAREVSGRIPRALCIGALCVAAIAPVLFARLPPLYDYYHWLFEGQLLSRIAFGSVPERAAISEAYSLASTPVPNQLASVVLAALCGIAPPLTAGRIFLVLVILLFAASFAFLVRSVQERPTVVELLGVPWAVGYFFYKGYHSYLVSIGLAFIAIGLMYRIRRTGPYPPRGVRWIALSALAAGLYLSHAAGWGTFVLFVLVEAVTLVRRKAAADAARLAAILAPSFLLFAWYAAFPIGSRRADFYRSLIAKFQSLAESRQFLHRLDPQPVTLPIQKLNQIGFTLNAITILAMNEHGGRRRAARDLLVVSALLGAGALLLPISEYADVVLPDQRLIFPALLLAIAALPFRLWRSPPAVAVTVILSALLLVHVPEYRSASRRLEELHRETSEAIPPSAPVLSISIRPRTLGSGCYPGSLPSFGAFTAKWIGVLRLPETGGPRVNIMSTSLVLRHRYTRRENDLYVTARRVSEITELSNTIADYGDRYRYVMLIGCADHLARAKGVLQSRYSEVRSGDGYVVLKRKSGRD